MSFPEAQGEPDKEARLLIQAGGGDRQALRALYDRYADPLFSLAVRMLGDHQEAEEALQDTFIKIWQHAKNYDPAKSRPFTWVVTIMRRRCIDTLRQRQRKPTVEAIAPENTWVDRGAAVAVCVEAADAVEAVNTALSNSPEGQKRALEMALFSGMTHLEIAQTLKQPLGTVKSWLQRGLRQLRNTLSESVS